MTNSEQSLLLSLSILKQCCIATTLFTSDYRGTAAPQALARSSVFCIALQPPRPKESPATQSLQHPLGSVLEQEVEVLGSVDISATCLWGGLGKSHHLSLHCSCWSADCIFYLHTQELLRAELMNAVKSRMSVDAQHNVNVKYYSVIMGGGNPCWKGLILS